MEMALQLKGSKSTSNKHSEINRERSWTAGKSAHPHGSIASESAGVLGSKLAGRVEHWCCLRGDALCRAALRTHGEKLHGRPSGCSAWLLLAMLGHALAMAW